MSADVTGLVKDILNSEEGNNGFEMRLQTEQKYRSVRYASTQHSDAARWPKLTITYTQINEAYYLKDHLGNIRVTLDGNGNVLTTDDYYPFGLQMPGRSYNIAMTGNQYKFSGKELDEEGGLDWYYFGARYYDPAIGRWGSVDPLGHLAPDMTPYHYTHNNPLNRIDPDGRSDTRQGEEKHHEETIQLREDNQKKSSMTVTVYVPRNRVSGGNNNNGTGTYVATDGSGAVIQTGQVLARGANRNRTGTNGDTPTGTATVTSIDQNMNSEAYGNTNFNLDGPATGERATAMANGRTGLDAHGGGSNRPNPLADNQGLMGTLGCLRFQNAEIDALGIQGVQVLNRGGTITFKVFDTYPKNFIGPLESGAVYNQD